MFTLILKNNATMKFYKYDGLEELDGKRLYLHFNIDIDAPEGEYTYAVFRNNRTDVDYTFKSEVLSSILEVEGEEFLLRDLNPIYGILRIGDIVPTAVYEPKEENNDNVNTYFYE